jgi:hypothetical protein
MTRSDERSETSTFDRFREIVYADAEGTVTIIQDTRNDRAWVQSTVTIEVRQ